MPERPAAIRKPFLGLAALAGAAMLAVAALASLPAGHAAVPDLMAAPACQCSTATPIPELSAKVVHCLCGGMSCVVSEHRGGASLLQCVR